MKITVELVCEAQRKLIDMHGGTHGILNKSSIESAISNVYQTFDSKELYPEIEDKAAFICFSLIKNHAFVDGNKRIGISILQTFLQINNYHLDVSDDDLIDLGMGIASSKYEISYIKEWIKVHKI